MNGVRKWQCLPQTTGVADEENQASATGHEDLKEAVNGF